MKRIIATDFPSLKLINQRIASADKKVADMTGFRVPVLIRNAGKDAIRRFVEFFTANIRNPNTRTAYMRTTGRFRHWLDQREIPLERVEPVIVASFIEALGTKYIDLSVKLQMAAIRMMFVYLVTRGILRQNPALSVKGPKVVVRKGKTPVLTVNETRRLLESIDTTKLVGLRYRALIALMVHTFARVGAALKMRVGLPSNCDLPSSFSIPSVIVMPEINVGE